MRSTFFYLLLLYALLLVWPSSFQAAMPYLDSSWGYDLNYFLHSRFHFGPDVIFTYGPLGFLNNPLHVANDIAIAWGVHFVFWLALGAQLLSLWRQRARAAAVALCLGLLFGHRLYYDYWDYSIVVLSLVTVIKRLRGLGGRLDLALLPVLLGVSFLLKFSAFVMVAGMTLVYGIDLLLNKKLARPTAVWLTICLFSAPIAYLLYDPSFVHLFDYLKGSTQITFGFATAMATDSTPHHRLLAFFVCLLLAINLAFGRWKKRLLWSESIIIVMLTWIVFRHGFVRADTSHVTVFFAFSLVLFACLFMGWQTFRSPERLLLASSLAFLAIALSGVSPHYPVFVSQNWWPQQTWTDAKQLIQWQTLMQNLDHLGDAAFAQSPGMAFQAQIQGKRVMVFPNSLPYVAKVEFEMFPIYALQGYAAFTSFLDKRGAQNLIHANPPVDKIILEWAPIDGRNQFLDTPAMSLTFLANFELEARAPGALLLKHRPTALPVKFEFKAREPFTPEQWVALPATGQPLAMSIRLKQNLIGALVTAAFDQDAVYIDLQTRSGKLMHFRVPPQTLSTPGLIGFVPSSLDEMANIWNSSPPIDQVTRIRLSGPGLRWTTSQGFNFFEVRNLQLGP